MRRLFFLPVLLISVAYGQTQQGSLTVEKIMQDPKWIGTSPSDPHWNYNNQSVFFKWNPGKNISDSSYQFTINGKSPVKMTFENSQVANAVDAGTYDNAKNKIAYIYKGDVYLLTTSLNKTQRITHTADEKSNAGFSDRDKWVTYQSGNDLFAWDIADGSTQQLTQFIDTDSPKAAKPNQQEQWLIDQQLRTSEIIRQRKNKKDKHQAYLKMVNSSDTIKKIYIGKNRVNNLQISPDGRFITYNLAEPRSDVKNTSVPNYITESGFTSDLPSRPNVGVSNEKSTLYIFDRVRDTVIKVSTDSIPGITDLPDYAKDYPGKFDSKKSMPRDVIVIALSWNEESTIPVVDIRSLDNKDRWLMQLNPVNGNLVLMDHQHDNAWIGGPGIGWLDNGKIGWINNRSFFFQSEATGYSHLYSYDFTTKTKRAITQGNYEIQEATISHDKKYFYILTNETHPGKQHFYRIKTDGSGKEKITSMEGGYEVSISPDEKYIAYRYSTQTKPWELYIQENAPGKNPIQVTQLAASDEWKSYPWRDTKIFTFKARDGKDVYARIYEPAAGKKNNAAVIFVHGAGYLQNIAYKWSYYFRESMFNNLLADKGYTVLDIDYRASAGYGRDWRTGIYRHMGGKDLDDEVDAAKWLVSQQGIDEKRIGMYGGSYGGFMSLMAMFTQPDVFKAAAALRPVTDWSHYNDGYTSAILNYPYNDSIAYQRSSPINFAEGLKNHLLICHGMVDVNVHFQDAVRLSQRLIELGKNDWELAVFPVEDHGFVEPSSWTDEYKRILKLFETNLK
ncbi:MAG: S9 family peptidase [Bacteroidetes bacterium]|nr:S9 family peptidase [Bacteroidota bacterium]